MEKEKKNQKLFKYLMSGLYLRKIRNLEDAEERVAWLLKKHPILRNNDNYLLFYYWHFVDGYSGSFRKENIERLTTAETVIRVRRHLQNTLGIFLPTEPTVREARNITEQSFHDWSIQAKELK